jgi:hypothetical protein
VGLVTDIAGKGKPENSRFSEVLTIGLGQPLRHRFQPGDKRGNAGSFASQAAAVGGKDKRDCTTLPDNRVFVRHGRRNPRGGFGKFKDLGVRRRLRRL